jgi:hypothetical protein
MPGRISSLPPAHPRAATAVKAQVAPEIRSAAWKKAQEAVGFVSNRLPQLFDDPAAMPDNLKDQLAFLDFHTKTISANLHRIVTELGEKFLTVILAHENMHFLIPGTLKMFMLLTHAANKVLDNEGSANLCRNLFDDFEDNTRLHRRGLHEIADVYQKFWHDKSEPDSLEALLGRAYEMVFQENDRSRFYKGYIIPPEKVGPGTEQAARRIVDIFRSLQRLFWSRSIQEFAQVIKPFLKKHQQEEEAGGEGQGSGRGTRLTISDISPQNFFPPGQNPIPPQGETDLKKIEARLHGVTGDLGQAEGHVPCSLGEFQGFLASNGIGLDAKKAIAWYYRDSVRGKTVKVPEVSEKSGALYPFHPVTWRISDSPQLLDPQTSLASTGILIPGMTTKKWEMKAGKHLKIGRDYPDLVLVLDCSPSMEKPETTYSPAIASSMIISHSFIATKKQVYALVFSEVTEAKTAKFTSSEDELDDVLVTYSGSGTALPYEDIEKTFTLSDKSKYFVMITDLAISNIDEERFKDIFKRSCGGTIFLIDRGQDVAKAKKLLEDIGFTVEPIKHIADLEGKALQLTKKLFEDRMEVL